MILQGAKGIKKWYLPEPNPRKVEIKRTSSLEEIFDKAKELYFPDRSICLGDSNWLKIEIDQSTWKLDQYYRSNDYKPSKNKLYVMLDMDKVFSLIKFFKSILIIRVRGSIQGEQWRWNCSCKRGDSSPNHCKKGNYSPNCCKRGKYSSER